MLFCVENHVCFVRKGCVRMGDKASSMGRGLEIGDALQHLDGDEVPGVVEVSGAIKWFDVAKGYGFIMPDEGTGDVLLHVTCLRRDGFQTAHEGARVVCLARKGERGMQAF